MTTPIRLPIRQAIAALLLGVALMGTAGHTSTVNPTLLQRLRQLIGLNRNIDAGGSRSGDTPRVCVLTPLCEQATSGQARAQVSLARPAILAAAPLNELRIMRGSQVLWQQRATSTAAIEGLIPWPIAPIRPNEQLTLLLRPRGASSGDFARLELSGASAEAMQRNEALIHQLGADPSAWLAAVDKAVKRNQAALALALLFAPENPRTAELDALRRDLISRGCGA